MSYQNVLRDKQKKRKQNKETQKILNSSWPWNWWIIQGRVWMLVGFCLWTEGERKRFVSRCYGETADMGIEEGQSLVLTGSGTVVCMEEWGTVCKWGWDWLQTLKTIPQATQLITEWEQLTGPPPLSPPCRQSTPQHCHPGVCYYSLQCAGACRFPQKDQKQLEQQNMDEPSNISPQTLRKIRDVFKGVWGPLGDCWKKCLNLGINETETSFVLIEGWGRRHSSYM